MYIYIYYKPNTQIQYSTIKKINLQVKVALKNSNMILPLSLNTLYANSVEGRSGLPKSYIYNEKSESYLAYL
ncbi:hypothetical protein QTP88_026413 [Uroleucon formosanum]